MNETINAKLARLLTENPGLPIKTHISGELAGDFLRDWCIGELNGCEATEYTWYEPDEQFYFGRDNYDLWCSIRDDVYRGYYGEGLTDKEMDRMAKEQLEQIEWHPCILLRVGP